MSVLKSCILVVLAFSLVACKAKKTVTAKQGKFQLHPFATIKPAKAPLYSNINNWAAHPDKQDPSDETPKPLLKDNLEKQLEADVFFVHPTIFTYRPKDKQHWNISPKDSFFNQKVDKTTIKFQASIFNQAGRVYAPRYRQAHYRSFSPPHIEGKNDGVKALLLAYSDVKAAFQYYIKHENKGRPFILAGHSQGSLHLMLLMQELIDTTKLKEQMICAYLPGWGITDTTFKQIPVCTNDSSTGCFTTWRTFKKGYESDWGKPNEVCTNPVSWTCDSTVVSHKLHTGSVLWKFNKVYKKFFKCQIHNSYLWIGKPRIIGGRYIQKENYHIGDLNIFYVNVRQNSIRRTQKFLEKPAPKSISKMDAE